MNEQKSDRTELQNIAERMLADGISVAEIESVFQHALSLAEETHRVAGWRALDIEAGV